MELLEREPSLALLANYAAEARHDGRAGPAGHGRRERAAGGAVSGVLAKLGVPNRNAAAAQAAQLGLLK